MTKTLLPTPIKSDFQVDTKSLRRPNEFVQFATWFGTPSEFRNIKSQKEFANSIGVYEDTLTDWKKHPQFEDIVIQTIRNWVKERLPDVVEGLYLKTLSDKVTASDVAMLEKISGMNINFSKKSKELFSMIPHYSFLLLYQVIL